MAKSFPVWGNDTDLWNDFRRGNQAAFDFIFDKYVRVLYSYGSKFSDNSDLVEDCIQDLFVELWERKHLLGETDSIKFYLFKSLRRKITRILNRETKTMGKEELEEDYHFEIVFSHESALIEGELTQSQLHHLNLALNNLSQRQKEVIYLRYYSNLPYEEIARIMALTLNSIYKLVSKAIAALKQQLQLFLPFLFLSALIS